MFKLKNINIVLFLAVFLLSLVNHGLLPGTIGLVLLIVYMLIEKVSIRRESIVELSVLTFLLVLAALHFQIFVITDPAVDPVFNSAFYGNAYRYFLCIGLWFVVRTISLDKKVGSLITVIAPLLKLHVSVFFLQFFTFFTTGHYIDLLKPFTGEESRYLSFDSSLIGIGSFRPTGFFAEPSNYSFIVLTFSIILILFGKYKEHRKLIWLAIISMFLSFSTAAVFTAILFVLYIVIDRKLYKKMIFILIASVLTITSITLLTTLLKTQTDRLDSRAGNIRIELVKTVLNRDPDKVILAYGAFGLESELYKAASNQGRGERVSSLNDAGLAVYMWARFGYLGIAGFLTLCVLFYKTSRKNIVLFLIVSLTKISLFYPVFILYFALSLSSKEHFEKFKNSLAKINI